MTTEFTRLDPAKAREYFAAKMQFTTGPIELDRLIGQKAHVNVVDVRAAEDYAKGHVPGAINLPKDKWSTYEGLSRDKANVLYCYSQTCHLAAQGALTFAEKGYPVMEMEGGFNAWKAADLKIETGHAARMAKAA